MLGVYPQIDPVRREVIEGLEYSTCVDVHLGLSAPPEEESMMIQVPRLEHPDLCVVVLDHNRAPGRAPAGKGLLTSYWHTAWADEQWDRSDADIVAADIPAIVGSCPATPAQCGVPPTCPRASIRSGLPAGACDPRPSEPLSRGAIHEKDPRPPPDRSTRPGLRTGCRRPHQQRRDPTAMTALRPGALNPTVTQQSIGTTICQLLERRTGNG
jgi:hypothetical protein